MLWNCRTRRVLSSLAVAAGLLLAAAPVPASVALAAATEASVQPTLLANLNPVPLADSGSLPLPLGELEDGRAVFSAADPVHGREPWVTDGTAAGTFRLGDLCPGTCESVADDPGASSGSHVVFRASSGSAWPPGELWGTDGTVGGTRRLIAGLYPEYALAARRDETGRIFVLATDEVGVPGLWVTDGTPAGTRRLPHLGVPGTVAGVFGSALGNRVLFVEGSGVGGTEEVWVSDGTAAGTSRLLGTSKPGKALAGRDAVGYHFAALGGGGVLITQQIDSPRRIVLWRSDATPAGTRRVATIEDAEVAEAVASGAGWAGLLVRRSAVEYALWLTDGSEAGTLLALEIDGDPATLGIVSAGRLFYLVYPSDGRGWRLLATDGTPAGSLDLGAPCADACNAIAELTPFRDGVAFVAGTRGAQAIWRSDGTPKGTRAVATLCDDGACSNHNRVVASFGAAASERLLLQRARYPELSWSLVASDGTAGGTGVVAGPDVLYPLPFRTTFRVGGGVALALDDGVHGVEPWWTDGTVAGTRLLRNLASGPADGDASPVGLTRYGERFLFFARGAESWGLYESDGTTAATRRLHALAGTALIDSDPTFRPIALEVVGERFFFLQPALDGFVADLKVAEMDTGLLRHLGRFPLTPGDTAVATAGDLLLWEAGDRLGVSDGTLAGSRLLGGGYRLSPGPGPLVAFDGGTALVSGLRLDSAGSVAERGVWRTDGTVAGTTRLHALDADVLVPPVLAAADGAGFFALGHRQDAAPQGELWLTDGTAAGTRRVMRFTNPQPPHQLYGPYDLTLSGGRLFFTINRGNDELWISDGTELGTAALPIPPTAGSPFLEVVDPVPFRGGLLFAVYQSWTGAEPWWSDGTPQGTRSLGDLLPGNASSWPRAYAIDGDAAYFAADARTPGIDVRIWTTDGTAAGTFVVDGAPPPPRPLEPTFPMPRYEPELLAIGGRLVYTAHSPTAGEELWVLPIAGLAPPPPAPPQRTPPPPEELRVAGVSDGTVYLTWIDRSSDELYFQVEARTPASGRFQAVARSGSASALVDGLAAELPYTFRVRAVNAAGASPPSHEVSAVPAEKPVGCAPGPENLCLGGRFRAAVHWRNPRTGGHGSGKAVALPGSDRSLAFWFFAEHNVELIVKALDGTPVNRRYWVFTGGLTDVEYWLQVVDTEAVAAGGPRELSDRVYHHRAGDLCGFADANAFPGVAASSRAAAAAPAAGGALALAGGRFTVEVEWRNPRTGNGGTGVPLAGSDDSGYFWFFDAANVELVVKVLDGRPVNGHWWVFWGGLTDVEYTLRVTDTAAGGGGAVRTYHHPAGDLCGGADTAAF